MNRSFTCYIPKTGIVEYLKIMLLLQLDPIFYIITSYGRIRMIVCRK